MAYSFSVGESYSQQCWGCPSVVMVKAMDFGIVVWELEIALLRSLSDKYPWERYEPPYLPSYGLNSTMTVLPEGLK